VLRFIASALNLSGETLLAQAGLIDPEPLIFKSRTGAEAAILADPDLTEEEEKRVLVGVTATSGSVTSDGEFENAPTERPDHVVPARSIRQIPAE
jgi:hypothetical protein